jgi:hypothetical protein
LGHGYLAPWLSGTPGYLEPQAGLPRFKAGHRESRRAGSKAYPMQRFSFGLALMGLSGATGLFDSGFNYFYRAGGISHTGGAALVIVSCLLIVGACLWLAELRRVGWLAATLIILLFMGLIGTALAAYFLEADILLALMLLGLLGWCMDRLPRRAAKPSPLPLGRELTQ